MDVVVVGAGPVGMVLAGELRLGGVEVVVVERRPTPELVGSRAGGFHARTIECLDQRGIADRFLAAGTTHPLPYCGTTGTEGSTVPSRHPYTLALAQNHIEQILAGWIEELAVPVLRGRAVTGLDQDGTGVTLHLADGRTLRAPYVVGANGGRSVVRTAAGIDFPGWEATTSALIAEVEVTGEIPADPVHDASGIHGLSRTEGGATVRVVSFEPELGGSDFGVHRPTWLTRFTDATRRAATYRAGRVLLVGDAAHVHSPAGGQGIGLGIQDAANLGWKLAQVVRGTSPDDLLDTYHAERHPTGARTLRYTMATSQLQRQDPRNGAVRDLVTTLTGLDEARSYLSGLASGLDVVHDLGDGHPLLGRRMPDLDLVTPDGPTRVFSLLHPARAVLLDVGDPGSTDLGRWADRVQLVNATYDGEWQLPVVGLVPPPAAVLVRPDGHVAWVGEGTDVGLVDALTRWCGPR